MASISPEETAPVREVSDLVSVFHAAEKPLSRSLLGAEAEKFAVHGDSFLPLTYEGEHGVVRVLEALTEYGWQREQEYDGGPLVALRRGGASITLEPLVALGSVMKTPPLVSVGLPTLGLIASAIYVVRRAYRADAEDRSTPPG